MNIFIHRADKATMVRCYRALPMTAQYARERLATALGLDFEINRSDFAPDAFLRICAKTGREEITDSDAIELLKGALAQCFNHLRDTGKGLSYVGGSDEEPLWPVFPDVQNTVWQLAQLGKYQVLLTFNSWIRKVADETERKANGNGLPIALRQNAEALLPELTVNMTSSNGKNT